MAVASNEKQWHHNAIGDVDAIWQDYTGEGVVVGIYDTGVDYDHPDLNDNITLEYRHSSASGDIDAFADRGEAHGTAVAGIIAAEANGSGYAGIAYDATIASFSWFDSIYRQNSHAYSVISHMQTLDVANWSVGFTLAYSGTNDIHGGGFADVATDRIEAVLRTGRDGLGTIIVKAAGNNRSDILEKGSAQGDWMNQSYGTIVVGATNKSGITQSYSSYGANVLISAPAVIHTTDISGSGGANQSDHRSDFGGTSASAPAVSGVVATMLEAAPDLGWRDVQDILAITAINASWNETPSRGVGDDIWLINGAHNWNGGGMYFHNSYGYGNVDIFGAVRLAEIWTSLKKGSAATSQNLESVSAESRESIRIDQGRYAIELVAAAGIVIEHIEIQLNLSHAAFSELTIALIAPDGTRFLLTDQEGSQDNVTGVITFAVAAARGMQSGGIWQIEIEDHASWGDGYLSNSKLIFSGAQQENNDIYHFTTDFFAVASEDDSRKTIKDLDGGEDWLQFATLTQDVHINLSSSDQVLVGDEEWARLSDPSEFENIAGGDGDDRLEGTSASNRLLGGRGNDWLQGGAGADTLDGGEGIDWLSYQSARSGISVDLGSGTGGFGDALGDVISNIENVRGSQWNDNIAGTSIANHIYAGHGDNNVFGRDGGDIILSGRGQDKLYGEEGEDILSGQDGEDHLYGGEGDDRIVGGHGNDTLVGSAGNDNLWGGMGSDRVFGGEGSDVLHGGQGFDRLIGGAGDDQLSGGVGEDIFVFRLGDGSDQILDFEINKDRLFIEEELLNFEGTTSVRISTLDNNIRLSFSDKNGLVIFGNYSVEDITDHIFLI